MAIERRKRKRQETLPILMYADTRTSADQLYLSRFGVPDPFISIKKGRRKIAVLNQLEFGRGLKESAFDTILSFEAWLLKAKEAYGRRDAGIAEIVATLAKSLRISAFQVSADFPAWLAFQLQELGLRVEANPGSVFPSRETKSEAEIKNIKEGNRCSAAGIRAAEMLLRKSRARRGFLYLGNRRLTSERLRESIEMACLAAGSVPMDTIAAGGDQACDPHCAGSGPLKANELIIVDVFPRVSETGYYGDMTRTFLKGTASDKQRELVAAVRGAHKQAIKQVKSGIDGKTIHRSVQRYFEEREYLTKRGDDGASGFFHGTGHGLGLEVHEAPRVSTIRCRLKRNAVITIEPGLYYPGLGGCRVEDVVAVRKDGAELLSSYPYRWELE